MFCPLRNLSDQRKFSPVSAEKDTAIPEMRFDEASVFNIASSPDRQDDSGAEAIGWVLPPRKLSIDNPVARA